MEEKRSTTIKMKSKIFINKQITLIQNFISAKKEQKKKNYKCAKQIVT